MVEHRPVGRANSVGLSDLFLAKGPWRPIRWVTRNAARAASYATAHM
jgi:hypothetical protein